MKIYQASFDPGVLLEGFDALLNLFGFRQVIQSLRHGVLSHADLKQLDVQGLAGQKSNLKPTWNSNFIIRQAIDKVGCLNSNVKI
jgi:hypothetical protein